MRSSVALIVSAMFSGVKPNWVRMKPGDRLSLTTRCSEKATSLAVSGLPEWNLMPGPDLEGHLLAVVGDGPAFGDMALQLADVVDRIGDQPVVDLRVGLGAGELERLGRVEADHVVDLVGDHQARPWASPPCNGADADTKRQQRGAKARPDQLCAFLSSSVVQQRLLPGSVRAPPAPVKAAGDGRSGSARD